MSNACRKSLFKGLTIMEMIISLAIMAVIFAAILPQFKNIQNSWASKESNAEVLQNGRILISHLNQNLAKAAQITTVSDSTETNGYIEFEGNDTVTYRYEIGADNIVEFGPVGNLADLAGPVSKLQFTCYDIQDLDTPITDVGDIRSVNVQITLTNTGPGQDQTFTTQAYLRTNNSVSSGLVAHWKFDEGLGSTAADSSSNNYDATVEGATWISGDSCVWMGGATQSALNFDGWNDYVDIDDIAGEYDEFTFAVYLKVLDNITFDAVFCTDSWSNGLVHINKFDHFGIFYGIELSIAGPDDSSPFEFTTNAFMAINRWYHFAVTYSNSSEGKIYLDGRLDNQLNDSARSTVAFGPSAIGAWDEDGSFLQRLLEGQFDDVRIYSRVLDPCEIADLAGTRAGLVGHWKFDEGSGQIATDSSGNSNDGQLGSSAGPDASDPTWKNDPLMGSVLSFDGSDDYITGIGDCPTGSFTVAGWAKDTGPIIGNKWSVLYSADQEIWFGVDREASQTVWLDVGGNGKGACTTPGTWTRDVWHHLAGTWDESKVHIYIDGVDMSITKYGNPENPQAKPAVIGAWSTHTKDETWDGLLDDVRIYHRALTEAEIQAIYNQSEYCCSVSGGEILP